MTESKFSVAIFWLYWVSALSKYIPGVFYWENINEAILQIPFIRLLSNAYSINLGLFSALIDREYWIPAENDMRKPPKLLRNHIYHNKIDTDIYRTAGLPKKNWFLVGKLKKGAPGPLAACWEINREGDIHYENWSSWNDDPWLENGFQQFEPIGLSGTVIMTLCMSTVIFIGAYEGVMGWTILLSLYAFFFPGMSDLLWHCTIGTLIGAAREGKFNQFRLWWYRVRLALSAFSLFVMLSCPFAFLLTLITDKATIIDWLTVINAIIIWFTPGCCAIRRTWFLFSSSCIFFAWHHYFGSVLDLVQLA
ncbi:unnamed protein product [Rhizophagus irregularis]|nr:unnamed protein product [Rhizophagus irregularis]CAB5377941.1 unnamed protein product [Rhizophagus irregularis]